jgi:two-component system nitrogen regulation sensor histidine kinase GlnL
MSARLRATKRDHVLVLGDRATGPREDLVRLLEAQGCVVTVASADEAAGHAQAWPYLAAILQPRRVGPTPLETLRWLQQAVPALRIVVTGPAGDVAGALAAARGGAFDYLEEPAAPGALASVLRRAREEPDPRLAARLEGLQAMAPGLVHELRNPLSGILAGSQMLVRLLAEEQKARDYARIVRDEAHQLERFLGRLAQVGRLGRLGGHPGDGVDLPALLGRLLDEARRACAARQIRVVRAFASGAPMPRGEPATLGLALGELIQNAVDAMPGGGTLAVATRTAPERRATPSDARGVARDGAWVEVAVSDTGPGMTDEARRRAGEPFFSTRPRALGIGLALAQAIAVAHGGAVRVTDGAAGGAQAILRLPAVACAEGGARRSGPLSRRRPR